jgi:hypothetical protein
MFFDGCIGGKLMVGAGSGQEGGVYLCGRLVGSGDYYDRGFLWQSELILAVGNGADE